MSLDPVSLAIEVGLMALQAGLQAMQKTEGRRINTAPVTVADYGTTLNYFKGTRLLTCPCFFAKPIREVKKKRKGKTGKQVTYTGFGTWAVHVADHAIGGILQVWFDDHLVYDATGSSVKIYPLATDYELTYAMRTYLGTEVQDPDPDMEAFIEARDGPGTCAAYRGTSYVYFQDVPLEQLGNRYPDVKILAYEDSALRVADTPEIGFVGQQRLSKTNNNATGTQSFALSGGAGTTPAAGDLVLILVASSTADGDEATFGCPAPTTSGYQQLPVTAYAVHASANTLKLSVWYKIMGGTPDSSWAGAANGDVAGAVAWIVTVWRGIDAADPFAADIAETEAPSSTDCVPPDVEFGPGAIDPGILYTGGIPERTIAASFALNSTGGNAVPIAVAARSHQPTFGSGNFSTVYQQTASDSAQVTAAIAFGHEYEIGNGTTHQAVLTKVAQMGGLEAGDYDFSLATQEFEGFNWTQSTGRQVCEAITDLFDVDLRPHDFVLQALPRGGSSAGSLPHTGFALPDSTQAGPIVDNGSDGGQQAFTLTDKGDTDLPKRVFLAYVDSTAEQTPNVAMPSGQEPDAGGSNAEPSMDMSTLSMAPSLAQPLVERWYRRQRFGRWGSSFALPRKQAQIEPADVYTPSFDGQAMIQRCTKLQLGADGRNATDWERDDPAIAVLPSSEGAGAAGHVGDSVPDSVASIGAVLDLPLLVDAHDQTAPLAYIAGGPEGPGTWMGCDVAVSDDGTLDSYTTGWDGIAPGDGAVIGSCTAALPDCALPWVADNGSSLEVTINAGELVAATEDELALDETLNLAAIQNGTGWEIVQFMTPTLTAERTYTITGFLRGRRGTEWAMAGHAPGDTFILLSDAKRHTLGASEIGDSDYYIFTTTGADVDQTTATAVPFTGASHKPYAPVYAVWTQSGSDWQLSATRRTRIGGASLDGQDVPLGESSESWALDIYDGASVVRTITGTSLPLTYAGADQTTDFGAPLGSPPTADLYQVDPTLNLRGYALAA